MWQANKAGITVLVVGLALLGVLHCFLAASDEKLADQVLALGFCLLLFGVGLASWLSVKMPKPEQEDDSEE